MENRQFQKSPYIKSIDSINIIDKSNRIYKIYGIDKKYLIVIVSIAVDRIDSNEWYNLEKRTSTRSRARGRWLLNIMQVSDETVIQHNTICIAVFLVYNRPHKYAPGDMEIHSIESIDRYLSTIEQQQLLVSLKALRRHKRHL